MEVFARTDEMADAVLDCANTGRRRIRLTLPSISRKRELIVRILRALRVHAVILSPNLAAQASWCDRYGHAAPVFTDAVRELWGSTSITPFSMLPYACAPVLLLTPSSFHRSAAGEQGRENADRLTRHILTHRYRLVILDEAGALPEAFRAVAETVQNEPDFLILELHSTIAARYCGGEDTPAFEQSVPALVRDGDLPPFLSLAYVALVGGGDAEGTREADSRSARATAAMELLAGSDETRTQHHRTIVLFDDTPSGETTESGVEFDRDFPSFLQPLIPLLAEECFRPLHPLVFSGASLVCSNESAAVLLPILQRIVSAEGWMVRFNRQDHGAVAEITGAGRDWNSRTYALLANTLLKRGTTKCVWTTFSTAAAGWHGIEAETLIDCSDGKGRFFISQEERNHDEAAGRFSVVYWSVLAADSDTESTLSDSRFGEISMRFPAPAGDGVVERGPAHADPDLAVMAEVIDRARTVSINERARRRAHARGDIPRLWGVGRPYRDSERTGVLIRLADTAPRSPEAIQRARLEADIFGWHQKQASFRVRAALGSVAALAASMSAVLMLPANAGIPAAASLISLALLVFVFRRHRLRTQRPSTVAVPATEYIRLLAESVRTALARARLFPGEAPTGVRVSSPAEGWVRCIPEGGDPNDTALVRSIMEICSPLKEDVPAVRLATLDFGGNTLARLSRLKSLEPIRRPNGMLPVPALFTHDEVCVRLFADTLTEMFACAEPCEGRPSGELPLVAHHLPVHYAVPCIVWE
ncbi:MAG: hypothetical protein QHI48_10960 [Bacteroidota bacterium]|nr:hypothetical protein [Bacteroidota bacterium]